ncbi:hypothetical protein OROGR_019367 [Orobanche gracilis]
MGFNEVYQSLQELFPQIDSRALRSVAIEHSKDTDAAVEAVLEEIIPFFIERSTPSSPLDQSSSMAKSSESLSGSILGTQTEDDPLVNKTIGSDGLQNNSNIDFGNQQSFHSDELNESFCYGHQGGDITAELASSEKNDEGMVKKMSADVHPCSGSFTLIDLNAVDALQIEVSGDSETVGKNLGDRHSEISIKSSYDNNTQHALGMMQHMHMGPEHTANLVQEDEDIAGRLEIVSGNIENDVTTRTLESSVELVEVPDLHESKLENFDASLSTNIPDDGSTSNATMSQSTQARVMDIVEESIDTAKDNKKTLFTAMESVISLMRQVELKEQAVVLAKKEAVVGGNNILDKVEELRRMLQHAKEANDMHAGEVYGEKAILGTELRELQSRLLSLSDERDKSLAILDEMHKTLELRLAAVENEIQSAEQEKLEKEMAARKLLCDQELIMEKVVQESKILKQHAEDNAKLQEFLVDRGRVVDMLQGEIAVICQDVKVLKEKFDEHVPLSKSLFSSQTSFILASSDSLGSSSTDQVEPVSGDLLETRKKGDHEQISEEKGDRDDRKALLDDGWDLFDEQ